MDVRIGTSGWSYDHWAGRIDACQRALGEHAEAVLVQLRADMPRDDARLDTCIPKATTDLVYVRMHWPDPDPPYAGSYSAAALGRWADRIAEWTQQSRRVLVYFNNDGPGDMVRNGWELRCLLAG